MNSFKSPWLSWSPNSTRTGGDATDKTDRRAFVGSVSGGASASGILRGVPNPGDDPAGSLTKLTGDPSEEPSPEAHPGDRLGDSACSFFWGRTVKGQCARCGHAYREHPGVADGGRD